MGRGSTGIVAGNAKERFGLSAHYRFGLFVWALATSLSFATALGAQSGITGDGNGAYKTHIYRDLFGEQGHARPKLTRRLRKRFSSCFMATGKKSGCTLKRGPMTMARSRT